MSINTEKWICINRTYQYLAKSSDPVMSGWSDEDDSNNGFKGGILPDVVQLIDSKEEESHKIDKTIVRRRAVDPFSAATGSDGGTGTKTLLRRRAVDPFSAETGNDNGTGTKTIVRRRTVNHFSAATGSGNDGTQRKNNMYDNKVQGMYAIRDSTEAKTHDSDTDEVTAVALPVLNDFEKHRQPQYPWIEALELAALQKASEDAKRPKLPLLSNSKSAPALPLQSKSLQNPVATSTREKEFTNTCKVKCLYEYVPRDLERASPQMSPVKLPMLSANEYLARTSSSSSSSLNAFATKSSGRHRCRNSRKQKQKRLDGIVGSELSLLMRQLPRLN